jgi:hypothetical protein
MLDITNVRLHDSHAKNSSQPSSPPLESLPKKLMELLHTKTILDRKLYAALVQRSVHVMIDDD